MIEAVQYASKINFLLFLATENVTLLKQQARICASVRHILMATETDEGCVCMCVCAPASNVITPLNGRYQWRSASWIWVRGGLVHLLEGSEDCYRLFTWLINDMNTRRLLIQQIQLTMKCHVT